MNSSAAVMPAWAHLRLPPFPQVAIRVLQLTNNEHVQLQQLAELISAEAAFASEVLTIANSALYAPRSPARSIQQAIAVVGANHLQGICLTVAVRSYLGKSLNHTMIRRLWRHNLGCAIIAEELGAAGFMDQDSAYTAGLLHDMGRLAFAVLKPAEYAALLKGHKGTNTSILPLEMELFGFDHCGAGEHLVADWKLPPSFEAVVKEHHEPRREDGSWSMAELVKVSCKLADAAGFRAFERCEVTPFADLQSELPERERQRFHASLEELAMDVTNRVDAVERL